MIDSILFIPLVVSFFITLFVMPAWIKKAKQIGLLWDDINKLKSEKVAGSGGIIVVLSFVIGVSLFVAYRVFILQNTVHLIEIITLTLVVIMLGVIGFIDDLFGWQKGGLSIKSRLVLCFLTAVPLMAINAGKSVISLPFIGTTDFGLLYPLILVPIAIIGTSTTFNFLAGFNGLEAGLGSIVLFALGIVAFLTGQSWLTIVAFCMVAALLAFLLFNFNPAKVFPGDVMTYPIGGMIAIISILGNFERIALFFFIPFIMEVMLKSRGRLKKSSFGVPNKDGSLRMRHEKIYGMTHLSMYLLNKMKIRSTETNVVILLYLFQIFIIILGFIIFMR